MNRCCLVMPYEFYLFRSVFFTAVRSDLGNNPSNAASLLKKSLRFFCLHSLGISSSGKIFLDEISNKTND
jgi:hypothetical protein